jgi:hypothetical protein
MYPLSVSCLADDRYDCHFGKERCLIKFNDKCVGLAFRQDKLYMISMHENANVVCNEEKNESSSTTNVRNKCKRCDTETSAKIWHCQLGHIWRGRIE